MIIEEPNRDAALEAAGYRVTYTVADTAYEMQAALLRQAFDIVISDHDLPQFDVPGALALLKQSGQDIPFIIVLGTIGEETAVALIKAGAHDYVLKDRLSPLASAVEQALQDSVDRRRLKQMGEVLRESEEKYRNFITQSPDGIFIVKLNGTFLAVNSTMCQNLKYSGDNQIEQLGMAAVIHDIGKIYIPADILSKPGKITDIEYGLLKIHAQGGYDVVKGIDFPFTVAQSILQHHERLDGSWYPNGLKGEEICLEAKILSVSDVVEATSSNRPYRPALGIDKALEEISKNKGKLYDPDIVDACVQLFTENTSDS